MPLRKPKTKVRLKDRPPKPRTGNIYIRVNDEEPEVFANTIGGEKRAYKYLQSVREDMMNHPYYEHLGKLLARKKSIDESVEVMKRYHARWDKMNTWSKKQRAQDALVKEEYERLEKLGIVQPPKQIIYIEVK